jgi:voltage-gated potassium channel
MQELKNKIYIIVFGADTKAGKRFDIVLLWLILASVICVILESIPELGSKYSLTFLIIELVFTLLFSIEFFLRIWSNPKPLSYLFSFWGIVDFVSILPIYFMLLVPGYHYLLVIRSLRLLRFFRIIKLARFMSAAQILKNAIKLSAYKIGTFLMVILAIVTIMGAIMYVVEGGQNGFTSIPQSIYWAVITITTVGYGDIVPQTVLGKFISSFVMIIGYAIIAVPTGIFTAEMVKTGLAKKKCTQCEHENETTAHYCNNCGHPFE